VCVIVPEGELPEWDRELALRAVALGQVWTLLACIVPHIVPMFFGRHMWEQYKPKIRKKPVKCHRTSANI